MPQAATLTDDDVFGSAPAPASAPAAAPPPQTAPAQAPGEHRLVTVPNVGMQDESGAAYTLDDQKNFFRDKAGNRWFAPGPPGSGGLRIVPAPFTDDDVFGPQAAAEPSETTIGGVAGQFARGAGDVVQGLTNAAGGARLQNSANLVSDLIDAATGAPISLPQVKADQAAVASDAFNPLLTSRTPLADPSLAVQPKNAAEAVARATGAGVTGALIPGGEDFALPQVAKNAVVGTAGALTAEGANKVVPDDLKPLVVPLAAIAGGVGAHGGLKVAGSAADAALPFVATIPQKTPVVGPIANAVTEGLAGRKIANAATDLPQVRAKIAGGPDVIAPGSEPTLVQQTGDPGIANLQARLPQKGANAVASRADAQNAARVGALKAVQTGGDPAAVSGFFRDRLAGIDADTDAKVQSATQAAQAKAQSLGGVGAPEEYGANLRGVLNDAESAARAKESTLWKAVDPDGTLTGNVTQTAQAAKDIQSSIPSTAKAPEGEEAAILSTAANLKPVTSLSDLIALRSRVSSAMRTELATQGRTPAYARMSQLRGAIEDNLSNSISDRVQSEQQQVAAGTLAPENTVEAQIAALRGRWGIQSQARAGSASASGSGGYASTGAPSVSGVRGAGSDSAGGSSAPSGSSGLPPIPQLGQPTVDAGAAARLAAASDATKARVQTFGQPPISAATAKAGASDLYKMPDGSVPSQFFRPGPQGFGTVQAALKAAPESAPILADYAALSLRRVAMTGDGIIDPAKFARWQAQYGDALRALPPEVSAKFADAATASQTLADAAVARDQALRSAKLGAAGKLINASDPDDVVKIVGGLLGGKTSATDIGNLVTAAGGDKDAITGLRQAAVDSMTQRFVSAADGSLKGAAFQGFLRANRGALRQLFSPDEMANMDAVAADLQRAEATPQGKSGALAAMGHSAAAHGILDGIAAVLGHHFGGEVGMMGGPMAAEVIQKLRGVGVERVDQLVGKALLDPTVARKLLAKVPANSGPNAANAAMRGLIGAIGTSNGLNAPPVQIGKLPQRK